MVSQGSKKNKLRKGERETIKITGYKLKELELSQHNSDGYSYSLCKEQR